LSKCEACLRQWGECHPWWASLLFRETAFPGPDTTCGSEPHSPFVDRVENLSVKFPPWVKKMLSSLRFGRLTSFNPFSSALQFSCPDTRFWRVKIPDVLSPLLVIQLYDYPLKSQKSLPARSWLYWGQNEACALTRPVPPLLINQASTPHNIIFLGTEFKERIAKLQFIFHSPS
jgi:hypothetical protein